MTASGQNDDLARRLAGFEDAHSGTCLTASYSKIPPGLVIRISGILDTINSSAFQTTVEDCLKEAKDLGGLILDLGELSYASSSGVGALTALLIDTQRHGIPFFLCRIPHNVRAVLDVLGFSAFFEQIASYEATR